MLVTTIKRVAPGVIAAALLAFAPSAFASTVSKSNGTLTFTATAGIADDISFSEPALAAAAAATPTTVQVTQFNGADTVTLADDQETTDDCSIDTNTVVCDNVTAVAADVLDGDDDVQASNLNTVPATLNGGDGDDSLVGGGADDDIDGGAGNDYGAGLTGDDTVNGGDGDDGGSNSQTCFGCGYNGGLSGGPGNDTVNGGAGNDYIQGDNDRNDGVVAGGNDHLNGGDGIDEIYGDDGNDVIDGGAGDDGGQYGNLNGCCGSGGLQGGNGDDTIAGGPGDDYVEGGSGTDAVDGQAGDDAIYEDWDESGDDVHGGPGTDSIAYDARCCSNDWSVSITLKDDVANDGKQVSESDPTGDSSNNFHSDVENAAVWGCCLNSDGSDPGSKLIGTDSANVLSGNNGPDTIDGGNGPDTLQGWNGDDTFNSRDGWPDRVECGQGVDTVTADQFDTFQNCENTDVVNMRSAYDLDEPAPQPPAPIVFTPPVQAGDHTGPNQTLTTDGSITSEELLAGITLTVGCDEDCTIEGRLLGSQPVGSKANTSTLKGFNVVLGRKSIGYGKSKRKFTVKPCVRKSKKAAASCRTRLRNQWKRKRSFTVKIQTTATDRAGNRTRKTKLIKVTVKKTKTAAR